jgi:serine/threonine-protein kinase
MVDAFGFDTSIDIPDGEQSDEVKFDAFSSDIRTYLAHRPRFDDHSSQLPGSKSSDPPTRFVRRAETHIELPPGSMVGNDYEVDHRLGAGAMGEVYAARHLRLNKRVAIKAISPRLSEDLDAVERFVQEARTLAQMRHPGLVDVLGFGELADGRAYFVMEFLSGTTLFDRLQRGRVDRDAALDIFGQIARALEAAHTHAVVHRDLKPENIFLAQATNEPSPIVKLLDFGLARLIVDVDRRTERTQSGVAIGTPMYMSPEQARGPDVDGRTDVYALGCIAYELLVGRHPFEHARTVTALIAAHMHEVPPMPRSIDVSIAPELDAMLLGMLAKDPRHRPTLPEIRSVLEGVRAGAAASRDRDVRIVTAPPTSRSISRGTIAVAVGVLAVGIAIGSSSHRPGSDRPAISALSVAVDGGADVDSVPPAVPDAPHVATTTPMSIDAGSVRPRGAVMAPRVSTDARALADATTANSSPIDSGLAPVAEIPVDAEPRMQPAQPTRGYLRILAPQGAQVLVDGEVPVGSPSRLPLAPGKHKVQFSRGTDKDWFTVIIEAGAIHTLDKRDLSPTTAGSNGRDRTVNPFARGTSPR